MAKIFKTTKLNFHRDIFNKPITFYFFQIHFNTKLINPITNKRSSTSKIKSSILILLIIMNKSYRKIKLHRNSYSPKHTANTFNFDYKYFQLLYGKLWII